MTDSKNIRTTWRHDPPIRCRSGRLRARHPDTFEHSRGRIEARHFVSALPPQVSGFNSAALVFLGSVTWQFQSLTPTCSQLCWSRSGSLAVLALVSHASLSGGVLTIARYRSSA